MYRNKMYKLTFLLFFLVLLLDVFLWIILLELLTVTEAPFFPVAICNSSRATLTNG